MLDLDAIYGLDSGRMKILGPTLLDYMNFTELISAYWFQP